MPICEKYPHFSYNVSIQISLTFGFDLSDFSLFLVAPDSDVFESSDEQPMPSRPQHGGRSRYLHASTAEMDKSVGE